MLERSDFEALKEQKAKDSLNDKRPALEFFVQAEVKQEHLTGNAHFDTFLSYIQKNLEEQRGQFVVMKDRLCDPSCVDPTDIMTTKLLLSEMKGRIESLEEVMALPNEIRDKGVKAREALV